MQEHRAIEALLDELAQAIAAASIDAEAFRRLAVLNARHYLHEEGFLRGLEAHQPALASKLRAQHEEALEVAARLEESLAAGATDVLYLARRYLAIAQHNIIEEERDVFPWVQL